MTEKVNPQHPDKQADRIAGAILDIAYTKMEDPTVAVEVLLGHKQCTVVIESSVIFDKDLVKPVIERIAGKGIQLNLISVPQDEHLAGNQEDETRCGDNGIFKGLPRTEEERILGEISRRIYEKYPTDGKYILDIKTKKLIVCQSCCDSEELKTWLKKEYPEYDIVVNPLGDWTGGSEVDSGCTNRKLGSDQGRSITGGGINGKDFSKADLSVNLYAFIQAQKTGKEQEFFCAIGDTEVNGIPYKEIIKTAREYVDLIGGFESLSEWGYC